MRNNSTKRPFLCVLGPDYKQAASPVERAENLKPVLHVIASQIFTEFVLIAGISVEKLKTANDEYREQNAASRRI